MPYGYSSGIQSSSLITHNFRAEEGELELTSFTELETKSIIKQIANALVYLHSLHLNHGDVKVLSEY